MKSIRPLLSVLVTATVALAQATAWANSAASIQTQANLTAATYDDNGSGNFPIVSVILSAPVGALDGYTYGNWAYLAADTTGSLDMFYSSTVVGPAANYPNPTVGDTILATGTYSVFDAIPEIENNAVQAMNVLGPGSTGNPPWHPSPVVTTIPTINVGTNAHGLNSAVQGGISLAGNYLQLNNVMIGTNGNWPTHANLSTTITDQSANSMTLFFWASSYSTDGAMGGLPIPQGLVDMTGFVDDFGNSAEFVPITITAVPEPSAMALCGLGFALAGVCYRLRKKA